jgi:hypothetical protein
MDNDSLINAVRMRAANPLTRTDWAARAPTQLATGATQQQIAEGERALGCTLHHLHRRLLQDVGNGGFGPGDGLIGLPGGRVDDEGRSVLELRQSLFADPAGAGIPACVVPLWDWGDGAWACLDEETGNVLIVDERRITDTEVSLSACMSDWVAGAELVEKLFTFEERSGINPFTRKPMTARLRSHPVGKPYAVSFSPGSG